jgi:hypothetical protein
MKRYLIDNITYFLGSFGYSVNNIAKEDGTFYARDAFGYQYKVTVEVLGRSTLDTSTDLVRYDNENISRYKRS